MRFAHVTLQHSLKQNLLEAFKLQQEYVEEFQSLSEINIEDHIAQYKAGNNNLEAYESQINHYQEVLYLTLFQRTPYFYSSIAENSIRNCYWGHICPCKVLWVETG